MYNVYIGLDYIPKTAAAGDDLGKIVEKVASRIVFKTSSTRFNQKMLLVLVPGSRYLSSCHLRWDASAVVCVLGG